MTSNESRHYTDAEKWLQRAEDRFEVAREDCTYDSDDREFVDFALRFAAVHAQLSVAADIDREASAEQRIAECVPEGGSRLNVAVAGAR